MQDIIPQWPLKVLMLSSDPQNEDRLLLAQENEDRLLLGEEHREIQVAIRGTHFASSLAVVYESACRSSDITAALDRVDPHILHFSGHGGEDVLCFENAQRTTIPVNKQALATVLSHQQKLQLVILNACFSLDQGQTFADAAGLAIVSEGSISDQDAIDFSREFYTALGSGQRSYVKAFERAKAALEMTGQMKVHLLQRQTPDVQDVPASSSSAPGAWQGIGTRTDSNQTACLQNTQNGTPGASDISPKFYIFSHQSPRFDEDTKNDLLSERTLQDLAEVMEDFSKIIKMSDFQKACEKAMEKVIKQSSFQAKYTYDYGEYRHKSIDTELRAEVHVFCPPLLEYIHFALALAPPDELFKTSEFKVVIHPDTRLLDTKTYSVEEGHESMLQLQKFVDSNAEVKEPIDKIILPKESERRRGYLATRFDQNWIDQRVKATTDNESPQRAFDASEFFSAVKGYGHIASVVIMAAPQICDLITSSAPLAGSDRPIQQSQIYELEELSDGRSSSPTFWKAKYFCRIGTLSSDLE